MWGAGPALGSAGSAARPARVGRVRETLWVLGVSVTLLAGPACSGDSDPERGDPPLERHEVAGSDPIEDGLYEWSTVPIGGGGFVTGLVSGSGPDGAKIYARTDVGGAYRWQEDSETWEQMLRTDRIADGALEPADYTVASIAVGPDPSVVALAAGDDFDPTAEELDGGEELASTGRVLVSTDGGGSWTASEQRWFIAGNQRARVGTERLAIDPADPERLYLGTQRQGLWTSTDSGATWTSVPDSQIPHGQDGDPTEEQTGVNLISFVADPDGGPGVVVAGVTASGIYRSSDHGQNWERVVELGPGEIPVSPTPVGGDLLVSVHTPGRTEARLLRLRDGATEVSDLSLPDDTSQLVTAADPGDPDRLVAAGEAVVSGRLWTSDDGGDSWRSHDVDIDATTVPWLAHTDLTEYMATGRLMFDPDVEGRVWFAEGMGVWRTDDLDDDTILWSAVSDGIEETVVSSLLVPPGGATFVTVADRQGFRFDDLDHRPNATLIDPRFASGTGLDYSGGHPDVLAWVGAESNLGPERATPRGAVSVDGGRTWDEMGGLDDRMYGGEVAVSATDPDNIVWLPTHHSTPWTHLEDPVGLYTSSDGGRSWDHVSPDGEVDSFHRFFWWFGRRALAADRVDGRFYLMSDENRFYVSDDGGTSWRRSAHSPPCNTASSCHVFGQVHAEPGRAGRLWAGTGDAGLWVTDDAGATEWRRVDGIDEVRAFSFGAPVDHPEQPTVYLHGRVDDDEELGVWRSTDGGLTWKLLSRTPAALAVTINAIGGDPDVPGRVLIGFAGTGAVVGEDPSLR